MRAVLDTNVVVSALIWGGKPLALLEAAIDGNLLLFTSPALLAELRDVLGRPHLAARLERQHFSIDRAVAHYAGLAITMTPETIPRVVPADADDDHVIAAAVAAKADLVVTGDGDLLILGSYQGIRILAPAEALTLLGIPG